MFRDGGRNMQIGILSMMLMKNNLWRSRFGDKRNVFEWYWVVRVTKVVKINTSRSCNRRRKVKVVIVNVVWGNVVGRVDCSTAAHCNQTIFRQDIQGNGVAHWYKWWWGQCRSPRYDHTLLDCSNPIANCHWWQRFGGAIWGGRGRLLEQWWHLWTILKEDGLQASKDLYRFQKALHWGMVMRDDQQGKEGSEVEWKEQSRMEMKMTKMSLHNLKDLWHMVLQCWQWWEHQRNDECELDPQSIDPDWRFLWDEISKGS